MVRSLLTTSIFPPARPRGLTPYQSNLDAFTHELFHAQDILDAASYHAAGLANKGGDEPSVPGENDTMGGTAERRSMEVPSTLGDDAKQYSPNDETDSMADNIANGGPVLAPMSIPQPPAPQQEPGTAPVP